MSINLTRSIAALAAVIALAFIIHQALWWFLPTYQITASGDAYAWVLDERKGRLYFCYGHPTRTPLCHSTMLGVGHVEEYLEKRRQESKGDNDH